MDILSKTSKFVKAIETRKDYDRLMRVKKESVERYTGGKIKQDQSNAKTEQEVDQSGKCSSCLWVSPSMPFISMKHLFQCTCLNHLSPKTGNLIKSLIRFVVGVLVAWIYFWFLDSILETSRRFTIISSLLVLLTLSFGSPFSSYVRLMCLISIPTICSSSGRAILTMIIFVEIFRGPVINTTYNLHQVGSSVSCGSDVMKGNKTLSEVLSEKSKEIFSRVIDPIKKYNQKVAQSITTVAAVSGRMVGRVKKMKGMYDRLNVKCTKIARKMKVSCDRIGKESWFKGTICWIMDLVGRLDKYNQVHLERFCSPYILAARILGKYLIGSTLIPALLHLKNDLYFDIQPNFNYTYTLNQSISARDVVRRVKTDLTPLFRWMTILVTVITSLSPLASLLILIRSHFYRSKYLSIDHYDNIYTTSYVYDIDRRRAAMNQEPTDGNNLKDGERGLDRRRAAMNQEPTDGNNLKDGESGLVGRIPSLDAGLRSGTRQGLETIFPLSKGEKKRFIEPTNLSWSSFESRRFFISLTFFLFTLFLAVTYILLDYLLYWTLDLVAGLKDNLDINYASKDQDNSFVIDVQGDGDLAKMYNNNSDVIAAIKDGSMDNFWNCWPEPSIPDYDTYRLIQTLLIVCLITIVIESYTLRLRHIFCDYYYPDRAEIRAVWLYNQIIQSRSAFMRSIYSYFHSDQTKQNMNGVTIMDRVTICCPCIRWIKDITGKKNIYCSNCGRKDRRDEKKDRRDEKYREDFKRCESTPNCPGVFCTRCLIMIENVCTICSNPVTFVDYDDGDQSEEVDSSDDDQDLTSLDDELNEEDILTRNKMEKLARQFIRFGNRRDKYKTINLDYLLLDQRDEHEGVSDYEDKMRVVLERVKELGLENKF